MTVYVDVSRIASFKVPQKPVEPMSPAALSALLDTPDLGRKTNRRNRFLMVFMYETAARLGEVLSVRIKDLWLDHEVPCVCLAGKGRKSRLIPISARASAHLAQYLEEFHSDDSIGNELLFYIDSKGKRRALSQDTVARFLEIYRQKASLESPEIPDRVHAHLFRHSRATHLDRPGVPLPYIQKFLGHSNIDTTNIYASADISMLKDALERIPFLNYANKDAAAVWKSDDEIMLKLCGLK
jgi:site-specific recombinase XerD